MPQCPIWLQIFRTELTKQFYDKYMTESTTFLDILLLQSCFSIIFINILHDTSNLISEVILWHSFSEVSELHPFLMVLFFLLPKLSFLSACGMVWCPIYYLFCPRVCPIPPSSITSGPSPAPSFLPPLIFLQSTFLNKAAEKNSPRILRDHSGINHFWGSSDVSKNYKTSCKRCTSPTPTPWADFQSFQQQCQDTHSESLIQYQCNLTRI